jgi:amino acid transporter
VVLTAFYMLLGLALGDLRGADELLPQLALARQAGAPGVAAVVGLSLLASFTSFNGALLGLGRFVAALGREGLLPRKLGRIDGRTLVPRAALDTLLVAVLGSAAVIGRFLPPLLFTSALVAASLYAACALASRRPPFRQVTHAD